MASASGIKAGKAYVEIGADNSTLVRVLKQSERFLTGLGSTVRSLGLGLSAAGSALAAPLGVALRSFEQMGSTLNDLSSRTGMTAERLSELAFASSQSGSSIEETESAIRKMQKTIAAGASGNEAAAASLQSIGLSVSDLAAMSPDDQFDRIAASVAAIPDPTRRAAAAMEIFGKSGTKGLAFFAELNQHAARLRQLNGIFTAQDVRIADAFGDSLGEIRTALGAVSKSVGRTLAPTLTSIASAGADMVASFSRFVDTNPALVAGMAALAVTLTAAGAVAIAAGAGLTALGLAAKLTGTALTFLVSPIGLVATALGFVVVKSGLLGDALDGLQKHWPKLKSDAVDAISAIGNALMAGEWKLAADAAFAGLEVAWRSGTKTLDDIWKKFVDGLADSHLNAFSGLAKDVEKAKAAGQIEFEKMKSRGSSMEMKSFGGSMFELFASALGGGQVEIGGKDGFISLKGEVVGQAIDEIVDQQNDPQLVEARAKEKARLDARIAEIEAGRDRKIKEIDDLIKGAKEQGEKDRNQQGDEKSPELQAAEARYKNLLDQLRNLQQAGGPGGAGGPGVQNVPDNIREGIRSAIDSAFGAGGPRSTFAQERASFAKTESLQTKQLNQLEQIERNTRLAGLRIA